MQCGTAISDLCDPPNTLLHPSPARVPQIEVAAKLAREEEVYQKGLAAAEEERKVSGRGWSLCGEGVWELRAGVCMCVCVCTLAVGPSRSRLRHSLCVRNQLLC